MPWHGEGTLALSGSWFGSLCTGFSPCHAHGVASSAWSLECQAGIRTLLHYLCPVLLLVPSVLMQTCFDPLVGLSFCIPAFLNAQPLSLYHYIVDGVLGSYPNLPAGNFPETFLFYCSNPMDWVFLSDLQAYKENPAHVLIVSDSF